MSPFYQTVELNTRERLSLAPGSYGSSSQPGLKILSYIDKASKPDKTGAMRHSFLVAATRPSREQLQQAATANGNGKAAAAGDAIPFDEPSYEGTAFLSITLHEDWKHPAALAIAFTEATRNKEGIIGHDYVAEAVAAGEFEQQIAIDGQAYYRKVAIDKVIAANTPEDQIQAAVETQYRKELMQISIKMGEYFTLQDWAGIPRDPNHDPITLVGAEFAGKVEASNMPGKTGSEVTRVYSLSKKKAAA
jgi:hypothetical protein